MKLIRVLIMTIALALPALACNIAMPSNPQPPIPTFVPSENDANTFEQNFANAVSQASQTGNFNITVNQQEFSSWLALRAPDYAKQQGYEWPLKQVQAGLNNGKITLYGVVSQPNVPDTPAQIIFTPSIDSTGSLAVTVDSGQFGVVGAPSALLQKLNKTIKDLLTTQLAQIQGRYKLNAITIANGSLTVGGQIVR
jgi:hypothetical protein